MKYLIFILLLFPGQSLANTQQDLVCSYAEKRLIEVQTDWSHNGFYKEKKPISGLWRENLARGFTSTSSVYTAWSKSPTHNANLIATSTYSCLRSANKHWILITWRPK